MSFFRKIQDNLTISIEFTFGREFAVRAKGNTRFAGQHIGNVGVMAVATDILADFINDEEIGMFNHDMTHECFCFFQIFRFLFDDFIRSEGDNGMRLIGCIFQKADAADNRSILQNNLAIPLDVFCHMDKALFMDSFSTMLFSHTDDSHLHQAAFIRADKLGMCFNAAQHDDAIRFGSIFINKYRAAIIGRTNLFCFHRRTDRATYIIFHDTIAVDNLSLSFRRSTAMTSHSREYERFGTFFLDIRGNGLDNEGRIGYTTAAAGNGNRHAWFYFRGNNITIELGPDDTGDIFRFNIRQIKFLMYFHHLRNKYILT